MSDTLDYLRMFAEYPAAARRFLREPLTLEKARRITYDQQQRREENFLNLVDKSIYNHASSPYLALLKLAGCELADVKALVKKSGVDGTLTELNEAGVYITFEEFKGRKPIIRHGQLIPVTPQSFDNPATRQEFTMQSGGSTGLGVYVSHNLDHIASSATNHLLMLAAHGVLDVPAALWGNILPGSGLYFVLNRIYSRQATLRWFSSIGWRDSKYWPKYDAATLYMLFWLRLLGAHVPMPIVTRVDKALIVARWLKDTAQKSGRSLLYANVSRAVRVCAAAEAASLDLSGVAMRIGGEPVTEAKTNAIRRVGATPMSTYGSIETGGIGLGCARPLDASDVHLLTDAFALITHAHQVEGANITVPAINLTTLRDTAPKVMLNYQSDDYGIVETRSCGCELESYGYTTHLRKIHSYSKLLGEGVTLIGNEMVHIIEQVLPARFGGSILDYQLMEEEDSQGFTRLYLLISPRLQIPNEDEVVKIVLEGMRNASPTADATRLMWQQTNTIRIRRAEPIPTPAGKVLPLYIRRSNPTH